MKKENKLHCKICKKLLPIDKGKSNRNWTAYKPKCPCGGDPDFERMIKEN